LVLNITSTTLQKWAVVRIEDYGWKESNDGMSGTSLWASCSMPILNK